MDLTTIYSKTPKGLRARASLVGGLSSHLMKVLTHVDGNTQADDILLKFDKLSPQQLSSDLAKLAQEGYIRVATVTTGTDDSWALTINFEPMQVEEFQSEEELEAVAQASKVKQEEEKRLAEAEKADKKAQKIRDNEKIKAEVKVKAQLETEREQQAAAEATEAARVKAQAKIALEAKLKAQKAAEELEKQQAAERAAKLVEETRLKAELKAREAAEQAEAAAEAAAKARAKHEIERISREAEETQKKQALEAKVKQEAERLEALRLAEAEAAEKVRKEQLQQQQLAAEALEKKRLETEKIAQEAALKIQQAKDKLAQEKLRKEAIEKEKLAKQQAHSQIANVLRKAEEDRKKAAAQLKAEKLEAKRLAKEEQEQRLLAERKRKEEAKDLTKAQTKQQRLTAQTVQKVKKVATENVRTVQEKITKPAEITQAETIQLDPVQTLKQEIAALGFRTKTPIETETEKNENQTAQIVKAKLAVEEQANLAAKQNARLEMERIAREAELVRQKTSAEESLAINNKGSSDNDLPNFDDFFAAEAAEEAAFEDEEQEAEAEQKIQRTIQITAKKSAEDAGRADIKNAAIAEAEALASVHGKTPLSVYIKKIKQWLGSASKVTFIYVPVLALVLLVLMHFINISTLIKPIEQLATDSIGEPVTIKKVHASLWPQPHLVLENVSIGANSIKAIHVLPEVTSLYEETKLVKSLEIEGLNIEHADFGIPLNWASKISTAKNIEVEEIKVKNLTLAIRDLQLESFDGKVMLNENGMLNAVDLVSSNNALSVKILPRGGDYEIKITAENWVLPFNQKVMFSDLNAKGLVNQNQISFYQIEAKVYGGSMTGQAKLQWPNGADQWSSSADFVLTDANAEQLMNTFGSAVEIDGKLTLKGNYSSTAYEASKMAVATNLSANFDVRQGRIQGVELARVVMNPGSQSLAGDSTIFDKLSGNIKIKQDQYQFSKLVLSSSQLNANGFISINNQTLTGRVNADLATQARRLQANFGITGRGKDLKSN